MPASLWSGKQGKIMMTRVWKTVLLALTQFLHLCRAVYCWVFGFLFCCAVGPLISTIRESTHDHAIDKGDIAAIAMLASYVVIFITAWWTVFRHTRSSKQWAIAASFVMATPEFPLLLVGGWQVFWESQRGWLPFMPFGVLGIIAFSVPSRQTPPDSSTGKQETNTDIEFLQWRTLQRALKIGRMLYCWAFFIAAIWGIGSFGLNVLRASLKHSAVFSDLAQDAIFAVVFGIAWWMILRNRPAAKQWAITINCLAVIPHLLYIPVGNWRAVWYLNYEPFPCLPFALLGIVIFSLPFTPRHDNQQAVTSQNSVGPTPEMPA